MTVASKVDFIKKQEDFLASLKQHTVTFPLIHPNEPSRYLGGAKNNSVRCHVPATTVTKVSSTPVASSFIGDRPAEIDVVYDVTLQGNFVREFYCCYSVKSLELIIGPPGDTHIFKHINPNIEFNVHFTRPLFTEYLRYNRGPSAKFRVTLAGILPDKLPDYAFIFGVENIYVSDIFSLCRDKNLDDVKQYLSLDFEHVRPVDSQVYDTMYNIIREHMNIGEFSEILEKRKLPFLDLDFVVPNEKIAVDLYRGSYESWSQDDAYRNNLNKMVNLGYRVIPFDFSRIKDGRLKQDSQDLTWCMLTDLDRWHRLPVVLHL